VGATDSTAEDTTFVTGLVISLVAVEDVTEVCEFRSEEDMTQEQGDELRC
jgi:hypothetical protein